MVGRATLTMVASSTIINWAEAITTNASPGRRFLYGDAGFGRSLQSHRADQRLLTERLGLAGEATGWAIRATHSLVLSELVMAS